MCYFSYNRFFLPFSYVTVPIFKVFDNACCMSRQLTLNSIPQGKSFFQEVNIKHDWGLLVLYVLSLVNPLFKHLEITAT